MSGSTRQKMLIRKQCLMDELASLEQDLNNADVENVLGLFAVMQDWYKRGYVVDISFHGENGTWMCQIYDGHHGCTRTGHGSTPEESLEEPLRKWQEA